MRLAIVILAACCVILGGGWLNRHRQAERDRVTLDDRIAELNQETNQLRELLSSIEGTTLGLQSNLSQRDSRIEDLSGQLTTTQDLLADSEENTKSLEMNVQATQEELKRRDQRIAELQLERDKLTSQMLDLNDTITSLETKISSTEQKLTASEGDRAFLLRELQRLQAEKAEFESRFNDVVALRAQVRKLKEELSVAKRLQWIKRGLYGSRHLKGAQRLKLAMERRRAATNILSDVEIRRDGGIRFNSAPSTDSSE